MPQPFGPSRAPLYQRFRAWLRAPGIERRLARIRREAPAPFPPGRILEGPGWILLPDDPVRAALAAGTVGLLESRLDGRCGRAGRRECLAWIPGRPSDVLELPAEGDDFPGWLDATRDARRPWCWAPHLCDDRSRPFFAWLGARRLAFEADGWLEANVRLEFAGESQGRLRRALGVLGEPEGEPSVLPPCRPGGAVFLELPSGLASPSSRKAWLRWVGELAARGPLAVVPPPDADESWLSALRESGGRIALIPINGVADLEAHLSGVRVWISRISPAAARVALRGGRVALLEKEIPAPFEGVGEVTAVGMVGKASPSDLPTGWLV